MSEYYFQKFPQIYYNGTLCTDITRKAVLSDDTRKQLTLFYPYELQAGLRPDSVADAYYDDSTYDWLIYLTNGIVDPYYGWYLDETNFQNLIISKYGSLENAMRRIKEYRLNANNDDVDISPAFYNNDLPNVLKKYYTPNYGYGSKVISYKKRQENWVTNTNRILKFHITGNTAYTSGELVTISHLQIPVGNCEVLVSNTSTVTVKNISGNTSPNNTILGMTSNVSANIVQTDLVIENISAEEYVYWEPVSYFEYENEKNESKRHIQLLDANYALETAEQLRLKMKEI